MNTTHQDNLGNIHASDPTNPPKYQIMNYESANGSEIGCIFATSPMGPRS